MAKLKEDVLKQIIKQLNNIDYGNLSITVHNGEIVQLDVTKKQRFDRASVERVLTKVAR
ncbi:MAG: YezD family protein [Bacilli bacterium]|jgi:hypothetical protein|uniref:YezD family protein n=1 Tax=Ureibacillus suwonensis TaxID=313007 RepID=A0ABW0R8Z6_9BACL|nr:DUF2292 domain-containing protein [Bacilli bacterium]